MCLNRSGPGTSTAYAQVREEAPWGTTAPGQYGSGTVIVWDQGTYSNLSERDGEPVPVTDALTEGHLSFALHGKKLHGAYALTRFREGEDEAWLLVKRADRRRHTRRGHRPEPAPSRLRSVLTGRTLKQVAAGEEAGHRPARRGGRRR